MVGPGRYSNETTVRFDLFADNNYPESEPPCFVIESELPWSPHFHPELSVCTGDIWDEADGNMLLGELMVHVAKLLNFDEPFTTDVELGYQPEAARYWVNELGQGPISKLRSVLAAPNTTTATRSHTGHESFCPKRDPWTRSGWDAGDYVQERDAHPD